MHADESILLTNRIDLFAFLLAQVLLPALETAIADEAWRIREASMRLLGDLLHRLAGAKSAINYEADDVPADALEEEAQQAMSAASGSTSAGVREAIEVALGRARHDEVLSALYIARADVTVNVRTTAWRVWKSVVSNTPRLLREMLPTLTDAIIMALASVQQDRQLAAGRTLGELVSKMGEAVLPVVVPILSRTLRSTDAHARQGVGQVCVVHWRVRLSLVLGLVYREEKKMCLALTLSLHFAWHLHSLCSILSRVRRQPGSRRVVARRQQGAHWRVHEGADSDDSARAVRRRRGRAPSGRVCL